MAANPSRFRMLERPPYFSYRSSSLWTSGAAPCANRNAGNEGAEKQGSLRLRNPLPGKVISPWGSFVSTISSVSQDMWCSKCKGSTS
ncbi:unnamed protein product [Urochloa humidicola]